MAERNVRLIMTRWICTHRCVDIGARFMTCCTNCLPILDIGINENLFIPKDVFSPPEFWRSGIFILFLAVERGTERLSKGKKKMMIMKRKKARYETLTLR